MTSVHGRRPALAISPLDVDRGAHLMVASCEDCACSVTAPGAEWTSTEEHRDHLAVDPFTRLVAAPETARVTVDEEHVLLFQPNVSQGILLLNSAPVELFDRLTSPMPAAEARASWSGTEEEFDAVLSRLLRAGVVGGEGVAHRPEYAQSKIVTAWLHVTNACNLQCPYCYIGKTQEKMDAATGRAAVESVFRTARAHGFEGVKLKYAGGEATLNHALVQDLHGLARQLAAAEGMSLSATLLSNGVHLPRGFVDYLRSEEIKVMISLDGIGASHDVQRPSLNGRGSFDMVERTLDRLLDQGVVPHISVTITSRNLDGVAGTVAYALDRGLTFSLNLFRDNECASGFTDLAYEEKAMVRCLTDTFAVIEQRMPRWSVLGAVLDRGQLVTPRQRSCGVGQDYVVIDQAGRVAQCHMEIEKTLGDVFRDDPLDLIRAGRTVLNLAASEREGCTSCTWQNWCSGGCSVATFKATGRFDIRSPNCGIYKQIYPQALRLEGLRLLRYAGAVG